MAVSPLDPSSYPHLHNPVFGIPGIFTRRLTIDGIFAEHCVEVLIDCK